MEIKIIKATINDVKLLCELGTVTFKDTFAHLNTEENMRIYLEETFNETTIENEINHHDTRFYIVFAREQPAGYVKLRTEKKLTQLEEKAVQIERFYLLNKFHGKGIAQAMMNFCIEKARENESKVLWLGVWDLNPRAIKFYEKFGFRKFGRQVFMMVNEKQWDNLMRLDIK